MCASAAAPGRGTEKGGYRGHLEGAPGIRGEAGAANQPTVAENRSWHQPAAVEGNNVPAPTKDAYPLSYRKPSRKKPPCSQVTVFSSNSFLKQPGRCTLHAIPVFGRLGRVRSCLFLLVLPSIQTVLSAPDFHRFGLSCGRASLAESCSLCGCEDSYDFCLPARAVRGL